MVEIQNMIAEEQRRIDGHPPLAPTVPALAQMPTQQQQQIQQQLQQRILQQQYLQMLQLHQQSQQQQQVQHQQHQQHQQQHQQQQQQPNPQLFLHEHQKQQQQQQSQHSGQIQYSQPLAEHVDTNARVRDDTWARLLDEQGIHGPTSSGSELGSGPAVTSIQMPAVQAPVNSAQRLWHSYTSISMPQTAGQEQQPGLATFTAGPISNMPQQIPPSSLPRPISITMPTTTPVALSSSSATLPTGGPSDPILLEDVGSPMDSLIPSTESYSSSMSITSGEQQRQQQGGNTISAGLSSNDTDLTFKNALE
ncbi:hypothetical protein BC939DRAFT_273979 [Gamsiella multidivaricata]|uniref:uncharacterized protein n=1 Tax=Gamsiella multidivaricata TaxID=101098 RepID=UPI00221E4455|nr:uncharacterized protein BC939DRAFT_273979 [Gamsiella multidivaricata]KAI7818927.1 hypothetical protein BC939DRAFT_273979 [Gamsiella multidivaricata]